MKIYDRFSYRITDQIDAGMKYQTFTSIIHWKAKRKRAWVNVSSWGDVGGVDMSGRLRKRSACLQRLMLVCMASVQLTVN